MPRSPGPHPLALASARAFLRIGGWRYVGPPPQVRRAVCLAAPHTDNLDGLLLVLLAQSVGLRISWMVKDQWTRGPVGALVRAVGGVGIDRSRASGMVGQMVQAFAAREDFLLVIPPEGTRARTETWKSGFYRIALAASVPVVPGFLDYRDKTGRFGDPVHLTGDIPRDMDRFRALYDGAAAMARHPDRFGPVRLREETDAAGAA